MKKNTVKTFSLILMFTIFTKVAGLLRDIVFATIYGTGYEATAFFASIRIPTQLMDIGLSAAITSTFIPVFNEIMQKEGKEKANKFAGNFINVIALISTVISVLGIIFAPQVVSLLVGGFDVKTAQLTIELIRITFPMIIFASLAFSFVGFLQSYGEFNIPAMISGISNLVIILYLLIFKDRFGIHGTAIVMLIAWSLQLLIQIPFAIKNGYRQGIKVNFKDENIKKVFKIALPIIISTSVLPINNLVVTRLASGMGESAVAALEYAYKLYIVAVGVFTYAIGNMIFPEMSKLIADGKKEEFVGIIKKGINILLCILVPLTIGMCIYREDIIRVLYQRGAFDENSTLITSGALMYYSIGMIGFGIVEVLNKSFYARQDTKTPLIAGLIAVITNAVLSLILSNAMGINGLALATAITTIINAIVLYVFANRKDKGVFNKDNLWIIFKVIVCGWIMGLAVYLTNCILDRVLDTSMLMQLIKMLIGAGIGVITYYWCALITEIEEAKELITYLKKVKEKV